jgi:hypothetical protein
LNRTIVDFKEVRPNDPRLEKLTASIAQQSITTTSDDLVTPPRASNNQYTDSFGAPVKPSQFFNSVNNQQFESFYFGGGTSLDVYDATGLKLSWR